MNIPWTPTNSSPDAGSRHLKWPHSAPPRPGRPLREPYWPEIDGLRTIAVGAVVLFHLEPRLLGGGFTGVDVFFVISGYLITTLLMVDIGSGRFSVCGFYQRRIARLAPAAFAVVAVALLGSWLLYSTQEFAHVGMHGIAASLSMANIKLLAQGDYFTIAPDVQPLMHYWSLSVEEQFYFIFPLFLYFTMKTGRMLPVLSLSCAASFVLCIAATAVHPPLAFYLLPTRAWELLAGSSLAVLRRQGLKLDERTSSLCLAAGLALIALSFAAMRNDGFPGWIASLPVAGTVLVLAGTGSGGGIVRQWLSHRAMVYAGKRSYALYLWHWPVFSFVDYQLFWARSALVPALKIALAVGAAVASYRVLERPARLWLNAARPGTVFGFFFTAAAVLATASYLVRFHCYIGAEPASIAAGGISINPGGHMRVALIGDSEAAVYSPQLASIARAGDLRLNILSAMGENELPGQPETRWPAVAGFVDVARPDVAIIDEAWSLKPDGLEEALKRGIAALLDKGIRVIVITEPPIGPPEATRTGILAGAGPRFFERPDDRESRLRANATVHQLASDRVHVMDVADLFLNPDNSIRVTGADRRLIYMDGRHLSDAGTAVVRPRLEQALRQALDAAEHAAPP